jgi:cystathionine gamma-lyase
MKKRAFETTAVHMGEIYGEKGSLNVPIYQNSTFAQKTPGTWESYTYTRTNNPTEEALRQTLATLEGGAYAIMFSSGLAAINGVLELLESGAHIISTADIYGGTHRLFTQFGQKRGLQFTYVDTSDVDAVTKAIQSDTALVYLESPSNPLLKISDISAISEVCRAHKILLAVDNTMATPYLQRPLALGADIVIHSTSKYISGHTNVIGGAVVANDTTILERLKFIHKATGGVPGPFDCYLTMLGIKTLALRMKQHEENATAIAHFLEKHPCVLAVHYPGLTSHQHHTRAAQQMSGFGGVLSFELVGDEETAARFIDALELFALTISFGSVTSLVNYPAKMSHKEMPRDERIQRGFTDTLIRLSVGIESKEDLLQDIEQALQSAGSVRLK